MRIFDVFLTLSIAFIDNPAREYYIWELPLAISMTTGYCIFAIVFRIKVNKMEKNNNE